MGRLEINELTKMFDDGDNQIVAVDELDIDIEDGEFLVFVGPSGCGKSTTLRCIAGLERVTSGSLILDGRDITDAKPKDREMAMVFQNYALYPHMDVRTNLGYGLKITTDLSKTEINDRVEDVAELLEISELLNKKPKDLSGGQQQRVALGRAIIREPELFLMDEPLSNLDAKLRTTMRTEIQQLQQEMGVTTIYVTHDQTEAMTMGDKIAVLNNGQLQQLGTPLECYHQPANQFVAGFIGSPSMNFLDVDVQDETLVHDEFSYSLTQSTVDVVTEASDQLTLGIRPEHIEIVDPDSENAVPVPVEVVEPMGELTYVYVQIGDKTHTVSVDGERLIQAGDQIDILFPEEKIHLFDQQTSEAIKNSDTGELAAEAETPASD